MASNDDILAELRSLKQEHIRLTARLGDAIDLIYNLEKRLTKAVTHQISTLSGPDRMPRGLNNGQFASTHGNKQNNAGGKS